MLTASNRYQRLLLSWHFRYTLWSNTVKTRKKKAVKKTYNCNTQLCAFHLPFPIRWQPKRTGTKRPVLVGSQEFHIQSVSREQWVEPLQQTHTYTHAHTYTNIHTRAHIHTWKHIHTHMHTHVWMCVCTHTPHRENDHIHLHAHTYTKWHTAQRNEDIHAHTIACTHTHTQEWWPTRWWRWKSSQAGTLDWCWTLCTRKHSHMSWTVALLLNCCPQLLREHALSVTEYPVYLT